MGIEIQQQRRNNTEHGLTLFDDLFLLSSRERAMYLLSEIILSTIIMASNTVCTVSLYKLQHLTASVFTALLFCLAIADSVTGFFSFVFHFALMVDIPISSPYFHGAITTFFLANQISFLLMMLSLVNRFFKTKFILNYNQVVTQKRGNIALAATILMSVVFTSASEFGYMIFKKKGRLLIAACINGPIMLVCFILFIQSIRNLTRLESIVTSSLPSGFHTIITISRVHFMTINLVMLPWFVVFMVRRVGDLSEHSITMCFYWCFFLWKMSPLLNVYNVFLTNKRCTSVLFPE